MLSWVGRHSRAGALVSVGTARLGSLAQSARGTAPARIRPVE